MGKISFNIKIWLSYSSKILLSIQELALRNKLGIFGMEENDNLLFIN